MRLADGNKVQSKYYTEALVRFGMLQTYLRFEVLDCEVHTILGMPFLEQYNPKINWTQKTIKLPYKQRWIDIPTISHLGVTSPQAQEIVGTNKPANPHVNNFADLDPEPNQINTSPTLPSCDSWDDTDLLIYTKSPK